MAVYIRILDYEAAVRQTLDKHHPMKSGGLAGPHLLRFVTSLARQGCETPAMGLHHTVAGLVMHSRRNARWSKEWTVSSDILYARLVTSQPEGSLALPRC